MVAFRVGLQALALATAMLAGGAANGQSSDVGLVNMLSGDVSYTSQGAAARKAQAFMKMRQGDRFSVSAGAQLRVVYFQGSRQETWKGPAAFKVGAQQSETTSGTPAEVTTLPSTVPQKIAMVPELVQIAKLGRSGGVAVRGPGMQPKLTADQLAEVSSAKGTYQKMRSQTSADDITPELYLYSVLQDYLLYDDMKPVVAEMVKRQPQSTDVQELAAWVKSRTQ